jgi:hypothetical protein
MKNANEFGVEVYSIGNPPHWWWEHHDYEDKDSWNWLAIGETIVAFCLYYWLASISTVPVLTILSIISVPILLLRSQVSILRGVDLLKSFTEDTESTKLELFFISFGIFISCCVLSISLLFYVAPSWFTEAKLQGYTGWSLFWRSSVLGLLFSLPTKSLIHLYAENRFVRFISVTVLIVGTMLAGVVASMLIGKAETALITKILWMTGVIVGYLAGSILVLGAQIGSTTGALKSVGYDGRGWLGWIDMLEVIGFVIGICFRGLVLRLQAMLKWSHWTAGINEFSHNWFEIVVFSNVRHAPVLLPRAEQVHPFYSVAALSRLKANRLFDFYINTVVTISLIIVSAIYRWNIKANAWIWFPLAVALRPIAWKRSPQTPADMPPDSRRKSSAFWSSVPVRVITGFICTALIGYFLLPYWPKGGQNQLSEFSSVLAEYLPLKSFGIRYFLLLLTLVALISHVVYATIFRSQNPEVLDKPLMHQDLIKNKDQSLEPTFDEEAKFFTSLRLFTFASFLLFVYSVLLNIFIIKWPDTVGNAVWNWVKICL